MHDNDLAGQCIAPARSFNLKHPILHSYGIVVANSALVLNAENPVKILAPAAHESASFLRRRNRKLLVELNYVLLTQKSVGGFSILDAACAQLLRKATLPRAEIALTAPASLRRISRNYLHSEFLGFDELCVINFAGRIIEHTDQLIPPLIAKPGVFAAISIIPLRARRGRRFRCEPGFFRLLTKPASCSAVFIHV